MGVLRALVGGQWVDIGSSGLDEVFVGPDDPSLLYPSVELWYDTDETSLVTVTPWTNFVFQAGFANRGGFQTCQYRREGSRVFLRGSATGVIGIAAWLPAGYWPPGTLVFAVDSANAHSRVDVRSDGAIYVQTGTPATWVSFDHISFSTEV